MAEPALPSWIADHLKRYLATNGADGHVWNGVPTLLLTTKGRKSGEARTLPLIYGRDREHYPIVGARGLVQEPGRDAAGRAAGRRRQVPGACRDGEERRAHAAVAGDDQDLARLRRVSGQDPARDSRGDARAREVTRA